MSYRRDDDTGAWRARPLEQIGGLLTELAQQHALDLLNRMALPQTLADGMAAVRDRIATGLTDDPRITTTGLAIIDVRVVALRAEPEVERALQTPMREEVQEEADKATYGRRAQAVEHERAIAEAHAETQRLLADAQADATRAIGTAEADAEEASSAPTENSKPPRSSAWLSRNSPSAPPD